MGVIEVGHIYVASNKCFKEGILKIGHTCGTVEERLNQLFNTSLPTPFKEEFSMTVPFPREIEKALHERFDTNRENSSREFFNCTLDDVYDNLDVLEDYWKQIILGFSQFFYVGAATLSDQTIKDWYVSPIAKNGGLSRILEEDERYYIKNGKLYYAEVCVEVGDIGVVIKAMKEMEV